MVGQVIRKKLYDAATQGDAATFQEILQEDPYLLDVVSFPCSRNLLHIATMRGQVSIVEEVLKINPQLAWSLDSHKSSPLHIAAAQGKVEIASKLLPIAPEMCWQRDCHGMNPVHIAAMNGHVEILEEIIRHDPSPAREKVDRGQTALHLCVKRGQLRILQVLVNNLGELIRVEDDDGETVLHWAVRYKQVEIVRYLIEISKEDYQYSRNSKGITALGISLSSPGSDTSHSEITKILKQADTVKSGLRSLKMAKDVAVVVAILIAGMTFQAAISPPGGTWQDDSSTHKAGTAIMASIDPESYQEFLTTNTTAFVVSLITIMLFVVSPSSTDRASLLAIVTGLSSSVFYFGLSFITCATVLTPHTKYHYTVISTAISVYIAIWAIYPFILYLEPKLVGPTNKFVAGLHMVVVKVSSFIDKYVTVWRETGN